MYRLTFVSELISKCDKYKCLPHNCVQKFWTITKHLKLVLKQ